MDAQPLHDFGTEKQILFDDDLVEEKRGFTLAINPPQRSEHPALLPDKPWDAGGVSHSSVVVGENGEHKMWYYGVAPERKSHAMCYATSADGVTWEKPELGLFEYEGSKQNNIVAPRIHAGVFEDPHEAPERRYKMIGSDGSKWGITSVNCGGARFRYFKGELETWDYQAVVGSHSPDGIHWTPYDEAVMPWYTDTHNVAFWDESLQRYVAYVRWNEHLYVNEEGKQVGSFDYRAIARSESPDFSRFPEPVKVHEPDFSLVEDDDLSGGGLYNTAAIKYPYAAKAYLIFTSAYHHTSDTLDIQLATSRDGIDFDRWLDPFVRLGVAGRFDSQSLYMGPGLIPSGDELFFYYSGHSNRHDLDVGHSQPGCVGRLRVRRDGFASQDADKEESTLTTVPFVLEGDRLQVNMDASSRGWLQVEILDASGHTLWGYSKAEADRLHFNDVAQTASWSGASDLSALRGRNVRLRFVGQWVKLYAFQFVV